MATLRSTLAEVVRSADSPALFGSTTHLGFASFKLLWRASRLPLTLCALISNAAGTWRTPKTGEVLTRASHGLDMREVGRREMQELFALMLQWLQRSWEGMPVDEDDEAAAVAPSSAAGASSAAAAAGGAPVESLVPDMQKVARKPKIARCVYIIYALYTLWATQQRETADKTILRYPPVDPAAAAALRQNQGDEEQEAEAPIRAPARVKKEAAAAAAAEKHKTQPVQKYKKAVMAEHLRAASASATAAAAVAAASIPAVPAAPSEPLLAPPIPIPLPQRCWSLLEGLLSDFRLRPETREAAHVIAKLFAESAFEFQADEAREEHPFWFTKSRSLWLRAGEMEEEARDRERRAAAAGKRVPDHSSLWMPVPQHAPTVRVKSLFDRSWRHDFQADVAAMQESDFLRERVAASETTISQPGQAATTVTVPLLNHLSSEWLLKNTASASMTKAKMYISKMTELQSSLPLELMYPHFARSQLEVRAELAGETAAKRLFGENRGAAAFSLMGSELIPFSKLKPLSAEPSRAPPASASLGESRPPKLPWYAALPDDDDDDHHDDDSGAHHVGASDEGLLPSVAPPLLQPISSSSSEGAAAISAAAATTSASTAGFAAAADATVAPAPAADSSFAADDDGLEGRVYSQLPDSMRAQWRRLGALYLDPSAPALQPATHAPAADKAVIHSLASEVKAAAGATEMCEADDWADRAEMHELAEKTFKDSNSDSSQWKLYEREMRAQSFSTHPTRLRSVHEASQQHYTSLVAPRLAKELEDQLNAYSVKLASHRMLQRAQPNATEFRSINALAQGTSNTARAKQAALAQRSKVPAPAADAPLTLPRLPSPARDLGAFHTLVSRFAQSQQQQQDDRLAMVQTQLMPEEELLPAFPEQQRADSADNDETDGEAAAAAAADADAEDHRSANVAPAPPLLSQLSFFGHDNSDSILRTPQSVAPMVAPQRAISDMQLEGYDQDDDGHDVAAAAVAAHHEQKTATDEAAHPPPATAAAADLSATEKTCKKTAATAKPRSKKAQTNAATAAAAADAPVNISAAAVLAAAAVATATSARDPAASSRPLHHIGLDDDNDERKEPIPAASSAATAAAPRRNAARRPRHSPVPSFDDVPEFRDMHLQLEDFAHLFESSAGNTSQQPHGAHKHKRRRKDGAAAVEAESKEEMASAVDGDLSVAASISIHAGGSQRQSIPRSKKAGGAAAGAASATPGVLSPFLSTMQAPNDATANILKKLHLDLMLNGIPGLGTPVTPALSVATPRSVQSTAAGGAATIMRPFSLDGRTSFLPQSNFGGGGAFAPKPPAVAATAAAPRKRKGASNKDAAAAAAKPAAQKKQKKSTKKGGGAAAASAVPAAAAAPPARSHTTAHAAVYAAAATASAASVAPLTATSALMQRSHSGLSHASGRSVSLGLDDDALSSACLEGFDVEWSEPGAEAEQQTHQQHTANSSAAAAAVAAAAVTAVAPVAVPAAAPAAAPKRKARGPNKTKKTPAATAAAAGAAAAAPSGKKKGRPSNAEKAARTAAATAAALRDASEFAAESSEELQRQYAAAEGALNDVMD